MLTALDRCRFADKLTVLEENAGLHFLLQVDTELDDRQLTDWCEKAGFRVQCLSSYYHSSIPEEALGQLVINYSGLTDRDLSKLEKQLAEL